MRYETTVFLPKVKSCELNLGEVYETAHVLVNEKEAGVRVALPYSFEIGKLLHEGENRIIVEVVNTLANRQRFLLNDNANRAIWFNWTSNTRLFLKTT